MSTTKRRCLLIGHDLMLLDDLRYLLEPDFELLAAPVDSDAALSAAATFGPDTVIIDADNAEISLRIGESLREVNPDLTVTYLTSDVAPSWRSRGVSKTQPASEFLRAFRALFPRRGSAAEQKPTATLSDREREVPDAACPRDEHEGGRTQVGYLTADRRVPQVQINGGQWVAEQRRSDKICFVPQDTT